jgi:membrane protease YdiL (CAAX protease family)
MCSPGEAGNEPMKDDQAQSPRSTSIMRELRVSSPATSVTSASPLTPPAELPDLERTVQLEAHLTIFIVASLHLLAIGLAEAAVVWVDARLGLALYGVILFVLMVEAAFDREARFGRLCLGLTLLPLLRIVSLAVPLNRLDPLAWQLLVGAALFLAVAAAVHYLSLRPWQIGLRFEPAPFGIVFIGLPLGLAEYYFLQPAPLLDAPTIAQLVVAPLVLILCTGFLEELIYRGVLLRVGRELLGDRTAVVYVALLAAAMQFGWGSWQHVLWYFSVSLFFGWLVLKTGEIYTVSLTRGFTNVVFLIIAPLWLSGWL